MNDCKPEFYENNYELLNKINLERQDSTIKVGLYYISE